MIEKEYYPLDEAAEILNCKVDDLIHLGARDKLDFYIVPSSASLLVIYMTPKAKATVFLASIREPLKIAKESISNLEAGQFNFPLLLCRSGGDYFADFFSKYLGKQNLGDADDCFESIFGYQPESSIVGYSGLVEEHVTSIELVTVSGEENIKIKDARLIILASDIQKLEAQKIDQAVHVINDRPLSETERTSLLKLILGMAIDAYGYNPNAKNTATGSKNGISARLATHNIKIDDDTVRKYLNEAKKLL
jgi:hypothetical protein